jgi:hypothetical protein
MTSSERYRCARCDEVIGVYEPMVVIVDGEALHGSRAALGDAPASDGPRYHGACFAQLATRPEEGSR